MRTLTGSSIPNIDTTDLASYPYGRFKDKTSSTSSDGTEISERTFGDVYQGMLEVIRRAGITPSGTAEKKDDSDIADAIEKMQPVMILRCGYDSTAAAVALFGGKYKEGYSAAFVETGVSGTTTIICKLTINKDGVLSTEKYFVKVSSGMVQPGVLSAKHNFDSAGDDYYFDNDAAGNVNYYDAAGTIIANVREVAQFIISVYKIA